MKRLIVTGERQVSFDEVSEPECSTDGVLVRARMTAVSAGTEIRVYRAQPVDEEGKFLHERIPFLLPTENGYSMVGDVIDVGSNVDTFSVGDRVFVPASHKQVAAMPADSTIKIPDSIPDEQAVFLNIMEVAHIGLRQGQPAAGENVAVVGQGVIGLSALAYCRAFGLRTAAVDLNPRRLEVSQQMGADLAISSQDEQFVDRVVQLFGGEGADVVLEAASNWQAVRSGMQIARNRGKIVIVSRHTKRPDFNPVGHPFLGKQLEFVTSYGYPTEPNRWDRTHSIALTLELLAKQTLDIAPMITHRFGWSELPEVYRRLDEGDPDIVGAVIEWD